MNANGKTENYDLMSAVMVCLGKPGAENYTGILKFLEVLLSSSRAAEEKKKILTEDFGVPMTTTLEREVFEMCNLSQGVKEEGIEIGIRKGMEKGQDNDREDDEHPALLVQPAFFAKMGPGLSPDPNIYDGILKPKTPGSRCFRESFWR